ncbi:MAG: WYL domain-containing protein [Bacteroidales bacterium]|nr:WYL domain-containing protein [Bacteroidales bacterium]
MAKPLRRYIWLIETVSRAGSISYADIRRKWIQSPVNDLGERDYPRRTFLSHIEEIKELFGLSILCDRRNGYRYYIVVEESDPRREDLIGALSLSVKLLENQGLQERVKITSWSFHNRHIPPLLEAIERKRSVEIAHALDESDYTKEELDTLQKNSPPDPVFRLPDEEFFSESIFQMTTRIQPYYLEFVNHTWFLLAYVPARNRMEVFRLANISALEVLENRPFVRNDSLSFDHVRQEILSRHTPGRRVVLDDTDEYCLFNVFNR